MPFTPSGTQMGIRYEVEPSLPTSIFPVVAAAIGPLVGSKIFPASAAEIEPEAVSALAVVSTVRSTSAPGFVSRPHPDSDAAAESA
jgi:hypothetical protein